MDIAQHQFQTPMAPPPVSNVEKPAHMLQQQSVIQSNQQLQQQLQSMHDSGEEAKRREILTRRPSYRKILDDLAGDGPVKMENYEDTGSSNSSSPANATDENILTTQSNMNPPQDKPTQPQPTPQQPQSQQPTQTQPQPQQQQYQSLQLNGVVPGTTNVVQMAEQVSLPTDNTQYIITTQGPGNKIQAYTIKGQLPVALENSALASPQQLAEEANRKRELRLYKNREAARECRRKKKEYVKCLENRVAVLENQNKALIEELKSLKDLYCSKGD